MTSIDETAPNTAPDYEIFETFRDIAIAGELLTTVFHRREPSMDGHTLAPFVLRSIEDAGRRGLSQAEVAKLLHRSPSSATRLIDCMQAADIMQRAPHPNDRRINMITLTDHGRSVLQGFVGGLTRDMEVLQDLRRGDLNFVRQTIVNAATVAARNL